MFCCVTHYCNVVVHGFSMENGIVDMVWKGDEFGPWLKQNA